MSETFAQPQISGKMFLFEQPELLSKEQHGDYGMSPIDNTFCFCTKVRAVPINVSEILIAAHDYPVIFTSNTGGVPLAVVGVVDDVNLFVDEKGQWEQDVYLPAYVRRYPFAFASDNSRERMAVVIDASYPAIVKNAELPFFENGEPAQSTKDAIEFCQLFEQERARTEQFVKELDSYDLLAAQSAQFTPPGASEPQVFAQYSGVDEKRLTDLSDEKFLELRRKGILPIIYAQLYSMSNWRLLIQKRARRFNLSEDQLTKPALS